MRPNRLLLPLFLLLACTAFAQQPIDVTDQTFKVGGMKTEEMYFGFAAGDQVIFTFYEADKKELKELEVIEYPSSSKFSDYKTSRVENKVFTIANNCVYKFVFHNSALSGRVCKIKIQRIPASDAYKNYNTNVTWVTKQDTSWNSYLKDVITGYDTTYEQLTRKELVRSEQSEELITDRTERVHSATNDNGPRTWVLIDLPHNSASSYQTRKVVSWAYWIGVGNEANEAWKKNMKTVSSLTKSVASLFTSPLGAFAAGALVELAVPKLGEDVFYAVTDQANKELFMAKSNYRLYDQGKGTGGYRKFTNEGFCQGRYYLCLYNDNIATGIDATIKIAAIVQTDYYEDKTHTEQKVTPRYEKKIFKDPVINTSKVPVAG